MNVILLYLTLSVVMKSFENGLVLAHLKDITGTTLDPLQFATEQTGL